MNFDPSTPAFPSLRVTQQEHEVKELLEQFPKLTRTEIFDVIKRLGPMRSTVEHELTRLSGAKR